MWAGVVVFMIGEDTAFVPSFYWTIVTSSSIGYGDVVPSTAAMRWFTSFYRRGISPKNSMRFFI